MFLGVHPSPTPRPLKYMSWGGGRRWLLWSHAMCPSLGVEECRLVSNTLELRLWQSVWGVFPLPDVPYVAQSRLWLCVDMTDRPL